MNVGGEQNDLLAAAIKFGIMDLVEGQQQAGVEERCHQRVNRRSCRDRCEGRAGVQDAQVQAEMVERRLLSGSPVRATSCASAGAVEKMVSTLDQEEGPSEYTPAQNVDFCVPPTPQNLNIDNNFNTVRSPRIPIIFSESASDDESELNRSFDSITDPTAPWSVNVATTSFDRHSNGLVPQGGSNELQSPALRDTLESGSEDQDAVRHAAEESRRSAEQPFSAKRAELPGEERAKSTEERSALAGRKNLDLMKQMAQVVESTQISIKVKNFKNTFVSPLELLETFISTLDLKTDCNDSNLHFDTKSLRFVNKANFKN